MSGGDSNLPERHVEDRGCQPEAEQALLVAIADLVLVCNVHTRTSRAAGAKPLTASSEIFTEHGR